MKSTRTLSTVFFKFAIITLFFAVILSGMNAYYPSGAKKIHHIAFTGKVLDNPNSKNAVEYVDVYLLEQEPDSTDYQSWLSQRELDADAETDSFGKYRVYYAVSTEDKSLADVASERAEIPKPVTFWLAYLYKMKEKGKEPRMVYSFQKVSEDVIINPRKETQTAYPVPTRFLNIRL